MKKKIALIYSFKASAWVSCQKITKNLAASYEQNDTFEVRSFHYASELNWQLWESLKSFVDFCPDYAIFLDHEPHPNEYYMLSLPLLLQQGIKPKYVFHIYGDFTLNFENWKKLGPLLKGQDIVWLAPSRPQLQLLEKLIPDPIKRCPFPVDPKKFRFDLSKRKDARFKYGLSDEKEVYLYTGRLSQQKLILELINAFNETYGKNSKKELWLVGDFDNIGEPFIGLHRSVGHYEYEVRTLLKQTGNSNIKLLPFARHDALFDYYSLADFFVSLSVHNDEDYGMSVLEAGAMGLPLIITGWGGFPDFIDESGHPLATMIPVTFTPEAKRVNETDVKSALRNLSKASDLERENISERFLKEFSIEKVGRCLPDLLEDAHTFKGFTPLLSDIVTHEKLGGLAFKETDKFQFNSFYRDLYESYFRKF